MRSNGSCEPLFTPDKPKKARIRFDSNDRIRITSNSSEGYVDYEVISIKHMCLTSHRHVMFELYSPISLSLSSIVSKIALSVAEGMGKWFASSRVSSVRQESALRQFVTICVGSMKHFSQHKMITELNQKLVQWHETLKNKNVNNFWFAMESTLMAPLANNSEMIERSWEIFSADANLIETERVVAAAQV